MQIIRSACDPLAHTPRIEAVFIITLYLLLFICGFVFTTPKEMKKSVFSVSYAADVSVTIICLHLSSAFSFLQFFETVASKGFRNSNIFNLRPEQCASICHEYLFINKHYFFSALFFDLTDTQLNFDYLFLSDFVRLVSGCANAHKNNFS